VNWELRTIHEYVLLPTVPVHVDESHYVVFFIYVQVRVFVFDQLLDCADDGMQFLVRRLVPPVQVIATHGYSVIAGDDPIRICDRDYPEYYPLP